MYAAMNYRSNLEAPDLRPYFKHLHERVEPNSQGHTVISDFADKADDDPVFGVHKRCWFWTLDEAAILYNCARKRAGLALDIGSHTGWSTFYLNEAALDVCSVDPMYSNGKFFRRARRDNLKHVGDEVTLFAMTADEFFESGSYMFDVVVIDGNHSSPCPLNDAKNSTRSLSRDGIILLHDYRGEPIKEAYRWMLANGFQGRTYTTPNGVAVCWREEFTPPEHVPDPKLEPCV